MQQEKIFERYNCLLRLIARLPTLTMETWIEHVNHESWYTNTST